MKNAARKNITGLSNSQLKLVKALKSSTSTPNHANLAELIFDSGAFNDILASQPKSNLEHLKANVLETDQQAENRVDLVNNDFSEQPLSYVLTVHLRNILKSSCAPVIVKRHVANLCATYGHEHVAQCMRVFFPNMFDSYGHLTK